MRRANETKHRGARSRGGGTDRAKADVSAGLPMHDDATVESFRRIPSTRRRCSPARRTVTRRRSGGCSRLSRSISDLRREMHRWQESTGGDQAAMTRTLVPMRTVLFRMAKLRTYLPHAPVTEAVIDFRVVARKDLAVAALEPLVERLAPDYVKKGPIFELQASFAVDPKGERSSDVASQEIGVRMHSADDRYVAQFQLAGFSLSRVDRRGPGTSCSTRRSGLGAV